jgi:transposase-like protein
MEIVKKDSKRWCPYCSSNKWEFVESIPIRPEVLEQHLLVKYKCLKCNKIFLAEEGVKSKVVKSAKQCFNCKSKNILKTSTEDADVEIYQCKQCHGYMMIDNNSGDSVIIVDSKKLNIKHN